MGIDYVVNTQDEDLVARVMEITGGRGADIAVECAGVEKAINDCMASLKKCGEFVGLGAIHSGAPIGLDYNTQFSRELRISYASSTTPSAWSKTLRLTEEGKINLKALVTHAMDLEDWEEGFKKVLNREAIKVVFHP
jgi:L-iditol 2-dehydrogenase